METKWQTRWRGGWILKHKSSPGVNVSTDTQMEVVDSWKTDRWYEQATNTSQDMRCKYNNRESDIFYVVRIYPLLGIGYVFYGSASRLYK
jgi:hypothetical protein